MIWSVPKLIALMKMVKASMKMMIDARPRIAIAFLTTCCPAKAATVATITKYVAATSEEDISEIILTMIWYCSSTYLRKLDMHVSQLSSVLLSIKY